MNQTSNDRLLRGLLIALVVVMALQVMRVYFTLIVNFYGERLMNGNDTAAAIPTLIIFLTPILVPLLSRLLKPGGALYLTGGGLAIARFVLQLTTADPATSLIISGVATALALMCVPLAVAWLQDSDGSPRAAGYAFAAALITGLALDSALSSAFLTWDYAWQTGIIPLIVAAVVSLLVIVLIWRVHGTFPRTIHEHRFGQLWPLALVGPFFMLHLLFLSSVPFVASATGLHMAVAAALVLVGDALGLLTLALTAKRQFPLIVRLLIGVAMIVVIVLIADQTGLVAAGLLLVAHILAAALLLPAVSTGSGAPVESLWRTAAVCTIGSLLFVLPAILYYVGQLITLPISAHLVPPITAFILALAAFAVVSHEGAVEVASPGGERRYVAAPLALLVVPVLLFAMRPSAETSPGRSTFNLVHYNVHYLVNVDGRLDPEATAQVIESQAPDVVMINEMPRGWLIGGSIDGAEWLSMRLKLPYVYARAADAQFGNAIFSRFPIEDSGYAPLPTEGIPMRRSYVWVDLDIGQVAFLRIYGTHLSAYVEAQDRLQQVNLLRDVWDQSPRTIIAGDMNSTPGQPDIAVLTDAGLVSAQDMAGDPSANTYSSLDPTERIDWIFGSPDIGFSDFTIPKATASDHLPVSVVVTVSDTNQPPNLGNGGDTSGEPSESGAATESDSTPEATEQADD